MAGKGQGWLEMAGDGRGWPGMAGDGRERPEMTCNGQNEEPNRLYASDLKRGALALRDFLLKITIIQGQRMGWYTIPNPRGASGHLDMPNV